MQSDHLYLQLIAHSIPLQNWRLKANVDLLERVDSIHDLGVIMDGQLRFNEHATLTAAKVAARIYSSPRNIHHRHPRLNGFLL